MVGEKRMILTLSICHLEAKVCLCVCVYVWDDYCMVFLTDLRRVLLNFHHTTQFYLLETEGGKSGKERSDDLEQRALGWPQTMTSAIRTYK